MDKAKKTNVLVDIINPRARQIMNEQNVNWCTAVEKSAREYRIKNKIKKKPTFEDIRPKQRLKQAPKKKVKVKSKRKPRAKKGAQTEKMLSTKRKPRTKRQIYL